MKSIGKIKIGESEKTLYIAKNKNIYKYFLDKENIGVYDPMKMYVMENKILFRENTLKNELADSIKEEIINLVNEIEESDLENIKEDYSVEQVDKIEELLHFNKDEKITKIATVELDSDLEKNKNKFGVERKNNKQENIMGTKKDVTIKQELNFNDKVTDIRDLGQLISDSGKMPQLEGKKFVKLGIIESDQMNNLINVKGEKTKENTTRYSFVAIATDGTVVPMDLEQDYQEGRNPTEKNYQVLRCGAIIQDDVLSRFKIGEGTFSIKNGDYGELEVYHSPRKTLGGEGVEGNKSLDIQLETDNVWERTDIQRELVGEHTTGYRSVERSYQEAKEHVVDGKTCERLEIEDIDGKEQTRSHLPENKTNIENYIQLDNGKIITFDELATKLGFYKDGRPDAEYARKKFQDKIKENDMTNEQVIEKMEEDYNEEFIPNR